MPRGNAGTSLVIVLVAATVLVGADIDRHGLTRTRTCGAQPIARGGSSYYDSGTGKIVMDGAQSAEEMALTMVHEVNHAKYDEHGLGAKISTDTRTDYVRKMLDEEATAIAASIQMKQDLRSAGKTITRRYPLEAEYHAAYEMAVDKLKKSKPSASPAALDAVGRAAGLDAVREGFRTGKVVTIDPDERYSDYYGNSWDEQYPTRKAGGAGL